MTDKPIFEAVFGGAWPHLPPVFKAHYANRPFSSDMVQVDGLMKVELSALAKALSPLMRLTKALVPQSGDDIPVTVTFSSEPDDNGFRFDRAFRFPGRKPYHFRSRMVAAGEGDIIEWMPSGIGWHARYGFDGEKVTMHHRGYNLRVFGVSLPVPLEWLIGRGYAEERAIDDAQFEMYMDLRHAWFGRIYAYSGTFTVTSMRLS
ncbi:DUF4166 domain-containing protein [Asticcacaulis sp. ZE23SCel15]|uniref:DUF4166 domain-containing protein n=1 Tax=Asticcacaulis sp. ZE23SCel15 TaxID=3059027 RepID=UPI00265DE5D3|nr:DUF4166 domain-containing protein [Asticcacaulis sp. ZE23SCel15]WKL56439.1 DUF4166 domain-containing protein [Asticcacaulis sp. ZE23SCel15]